MNALPPFKDYAEDLSEAAVPDDHFTERRPFCGFCLLIGAIVAWGIIFGIRGLASLLLVAVLVTISYVGLGVIASLLLASGAYAHESVAGMPYNTWCCNGNGQSGDCQEIPDSAVRTIPGGYQITLGEGDHRLVTRSHIFTKKQSETRWSTDGRYHACLYPTEDELRCFYAPPPGV